MGIVPYSGLFLSIEELKYGFVVLGRRLDSPWARVPYGPNSSRLGGAT